MSATTLTNSPAFVNHAGPEATTVPEFAAGDTTALISAVFDLLTAINDGSLSKAHDAAERASIAGFQLAMALEDLTNLAAAEDTAHDFNDYRRRAAELVATTTDQLTATLQANETR